MPSVIPKDDWMSANAYSGQWLENSLRRRKFPEVNPVRKCLKAPPNL